MTTAASTEFPAAERFSARINSDDEMAGLPDMLALSLVRVKCAKQIKEHQEPTSNPEITSQNKRQSAAQIRACSSVLSRSPRPKQRHLFVLRFDAWHFQLSDGPILEEMNYA
jgi:hypothetical protein